MVRQSRRSRFHFGPVDAIGALLYGLLLAQSARTLLWAVRPAPAPWPRLRPGARFHNRHVVGYTTGTVPTDPAAPTQRDSRPGLRTCNLSAGAVRPLRNQPDRRPGLPACDPPARASVPARAADQPSQRATDQPTNRRRSRRGCRGAGRRRGKRGGVNLRRHGDIRADDLIVGHLNINL